MYDFLFIIIELFR